METVVSKMQHRGSFETLLLIVCVSLGKIGIVSPNPKQQERKSNQFFLPMEASGNSYNKLGKKKRALVDFCFAGPVMLISCRRCRGLFTARCTSNPNTGYLMVIRAGSPLSVMMVECCVFALRRLMQGAILTWHELLRISYILQCY